MARSSEFIVMDTPLTDALRNLVDFRLIPGQAHDSRETKLLIEDLRCDAFLGDRAFDADWLRKLLESKEITAIIPPKSNCKFPADFDEHTYKARHLIETSEFGNADDLVLGKLSLEEGNNVTAQHYREYAVLFPHSEQSQAAQNRYTSLLLKQAQK